MASEQEKDTQRAMAACKSILDGRDPFKHPAAILVTLEHAVATVLLACMKGDPKMAAGMLNEGLTPGVEQRLAYYSSKGIRLV